MVHLRRLPTPASGPRAGTCTRPSAIFEDRPFERRFRDVHAVTQQLQGRTAHYEHVGHYLLGLEPETAFT